MAGAAGRRNLVQSEQGSAAVEFALLLPIVILLMAGMIDVGRAMRLGAALDNAARVGAQYARAHPGDDAGIRRAALKASGVDAGSATVSAGQSCECPSGAATACGKVCPNGDAYYVLLRVSVAQPFAPLFEYPFIAVPSALTGQAVLRTQ